MKNLTALRTIWRRLASPLATLAPFPGSTAYWEARYAAGGNSGVGSYGDFAAFKAEVLNRFVQSHQVTSVIEFGCGDGHQLSLAQYPAYLGLDVSSTAVTQCRERFKSDASKTFRLIGEYRGEQADLALSLDVIFHLIEDEVYHRYMRTLFDASRRYVIIYSSNSNGISGPDAAHVRHRKFTTWVEANAWDFRLTEHLPNRYPYRGDYKKGSFAEFYMYERT